VEKYVDPADFFFVGAFKDDLSGDIVFEGVKAMRTRV
jgi:hypothetical protein